MPSRALLPPPRPIPGPGKKGPEGLKCEGFFPRCQFSEQGSRRRLKPDAEAERRRR